MRSFLLLILNFTFCISFAQTCDCDTLRDQLALKTFAAAMTGHPWDTTESIDKWKGITLNEMGCVEALEAPNLLMKGVIPLFSLSNLHCIKNIDLHQNQIFGPIPPDLDKLEVLESLNLAYNELSTTMPVEIGSLHNLKYLRLNFNFLSGQLPMELGDLSNLQELFLGNNDFSGGIPASFVNLTDLFGIDFSNNNFSGPIPAFFQNLSPLAFHINDNNFTDTAWVNFAPNFTGTIVNISNNDFRVLPLITSTSIREEKFMAQGNRFTFDDLLPNFHLFFSSIIFGSIEPDRYSPQKEFFPDTIIQFPANVAPIIDLDIDTEIKNNEYRWYKDDVPVYNGQSAVLNLNELFNNADEYSGVYRCEVENIEVPELTLKTGNITIEVDVPKVQSAKTPTAFTPNQDGVNDFFVIPAAEDGQYTQNEIIIYNRNGEMIFRTTNYGNDWEGTDFNNQPLGNGTYYFLFKSLDYQESGMITIQR
ncbi:MAG: T9SS type B sorting domain-containing protein [Saprospiraceae bacterium]|nr:T9SS type B sorting domain-containing protein [Saprospiraceae bacterium]